MLSCQVHQSQKEGEKKREKEKRGERGGGKKKLQSLVQSSFNKPVFIG